jgi:hypothetical protein
MKLKSKPIHNVIAGVGLSVLALFGCAAKEAAATPVTWENISGPITSNNIPFLPVGDTIGIQVTVDKPDNYTGPVTASEMTDWSFFSGSIVLNSGNSVLDPSSILRFVNGQPTGLCNLLAGGSFMSSVLYFGVLTGDNDHYWSPNGGNSVAWAQKGSAWYLNECPYPSPWCEKNPPSDSQVPVPPSVLLLGSGLAGLAALHRRRSAGAKPQP